MTLRPPPLIAAAVIALLAVPCAIWLGLMLGSSGWGWTSPDIVWLIRVPRVMAAFGTGAALALGGALIQIVTRNPLSDPHVLGVTSGASVGALIALMWLPAFALAAELGATIGALLSTSLVFALAWRGMGRGLLPGAQTGTVVVLLVGVMIGAACGAAVSFMLAIANDQQLRNIIFWLLGDLNGVTHWWPVWAGVGMASLMAWPHARELDLMSRGDGWAWTLGVPVAKRRRVALLASCVCVGAAVATAGSIGFVGLVAPHMVRLLGLRSAQWLLPFSALLGGVFLVLADAVARTVIAPSQLPVGVVSAAVGVPVFLVLLLRRRAGQ
ncbi:iron ABC transporter permease [Viridibacterium curvum]|uniref:Iron ABC transporter permease n=1 Tax=Viridibacterium curvum TaxID=1101404 RepID=A0ABP9QIL0_9RHOO